MSFKDILKYTKNIKTRYIVIILSILILLASLFVYILYTQSTNYFFVQFETTDDVTAFVRENIADDELNIEQILTVMAQYMTDDETCSLLENRNGYSCLVYAEPPQWARMAHYQIIFYVHKEKLETFIVRFLSSDL